MPTKIGHFEILSELAKSPTGTVYKANDPVSGQTVALKAIQLSAFGEHASALEEALTKEAESVRGLENPNLTIVSNASVIDGEFCAAMEYVQGNSIATMLARKEGFSIWDLLDIGRQLCSGIDFASAKQLAHGSLEPAKIMCGWDGTVKILSVGVSSVGNFVQHAEGVSPILHYMSPEQVRGEAMDIRSNLFSLGAMFYEMVTERKAFDGADAASVRQSILESTPTPPNQVNAKVHPLLSDLILKAIAKDPAERYQNGRQLLDDLEKCKETRPTAAKKVEAPKSAAIAPGVRAAAQSKFVGASAPVAPRPAAPAVQAAPPRPAPPAAPKPVASPSVTATAAAAAPEIRANLSKPSRLAMPKSQAAAAGVGGFNSGSAFQTPEVSAEAQAPAVQDAEAPSAYQSSAVADEPQVETFDSQADGPKIAVDPLMAEGAPASSGGSSFSEISELPPLKEAYVAPEPPPAPEIVQVTTPSLSALRSSKAPAKPKVQPREVAGKAIKEIKGVPPKLMGYALGAAAVIIVVIAIGVTLYIHGLNGDDDSSSHRKPAAATTTETPAQQPARPAAEAAAPATEAASAEAQPQEVQEAQTPAAAPARGRAARKKAAAPVVALPGQLAIDSTPQGAQVQLDGQTDPTWITPITLTNIQPGDHSITVTRSGYSGDTRSVSIPSGGKASALLHLSQMMATLAVKSDPPGANVYVDGKDAGLKTPGQVSVNKGQHTVLVRMSGYLDETMTGQFTLGQTVSYSPTLRALGNVDNIKTVGKMSKLFHKGTQGEQGVLSIHTQPKGAQVAINQHMLDKNSPVDMMLDPGTYVVDITLSGYAPTHKIVTITAEKNSKLTLDEVLQPQ